MNKTLLRSVREYKKQSILAPLLVILEVLMEVLIPLEMAKIIDVGIANGDMSYILQRGLILVVMAMLPCSLVFRLVTWQQSQVPDTPRTCATTSFIRYRISLSKTLTIFLLQDWLHV